MHGYTVPGLLMFNYWDWYDMFWPTIGIPINQYGYECVWWLNLTMCPLHMSTLNPRIGRMNIRHGDIAFLRGNQSTRWMFFSDDRWNQKLVYYYILLFHAAFLFLGDLRYRFTMFNQCFYPSKCRSNPMTFRWPRSREVFETQPLVESGR